MIFLIFNDRKYNSGREEIPCFFYVCFLQKCFLVTNELFAEED